MPARRPSIRDVAAEAGVSVTTVSDALSGKGRLNDRTRRQVREVAERMGFRPSAAARGLKTGRTGMLALTVSSAGSERLALSDFDYFVQLMGAATQAALDLGHALVMSPPGDAAGIWERMPVDGAIVVDPVVGDPTIARLAERRLPVVTAGRAPGVADWWVDNDHRSATLGALDHLAARGARDVTLLTASPVQSYTVDIVSAYRDWCSARSLDPRVEVVGGDLSEQAGYAAAVRLLEQPSPPDAIYATMDRLALGVLLGARSRGVAVPERLMVAAITDSDASRLAIPPVTAVQLHPQEIGARAVRLLVDRLEGRAPPPETERLVPTRLLVRGSTDRAR